MNRYLFEKGQTFSIRKLTVGVASIMVGLAFFASGTALADETKIEIPTSQPNVEKLAEVETPKPEIKNESPLISTPQELDEEKEENTAKSVEETSVPTTSDLLPEEINDQAYPDTPVRQLNTSAIVETKDSPQVATKSILKKRKRLKKKLEMKIVASLMAVKILNTSTMMVNPLLLLV